MMSLLERERTTRPPSLGQIEIKRSLMKIIRPIEIFFKKSQELPSVREVLEKEGRTEVLASDVAKFGVVDQGVEKVKCEMGVDQKMKILIDLMLNEYEYGKMVRSHPEEEFCITSDWRAVSGHHRLLALKILGPDFIKKIRNGQMGAYLNGR